MAYTRPSYATNNVQLQPDEPIISASALKLVFDQVGIDTKAFIEAFLNELEALSSSGNIGSAAISGVTGSTIYAQLSSLKALIDNSDSDITALEARVTTNEGDIVLLDGRLTTAEGNIVTIQADVSTNASNITILDSSTVKLSGTQTITGEKTFTTVPKSTQSPSVDNDLANKAYVDGQAPLTIPDNSITNQKLVDAPDGIKNAVYGSLRVDGDRYVGATKLGDNFQEDFSSYTFSGATGSNDISNVRIGSQSIRATIGAGAGSARTDKNNQDIDFSVRSDGSTSDDNDYIIVDIFISLIAAFTGNNVFIAFDQSAIFDALNIKSFTVAVSTLQVGWNRLTLKKSDANTVGSGAWSGIQSHRIQIGNNSGYSGEYYSSQLIQLVKSNGAGTAPNPFQYLGLEEFTINNGEWYVGSEFGQNVIKELSQVGFPIDAILSANQYRDFTITASVKLRGGNNFSFPAFYISGTNYALVEIVGGNLRLLASAGTEVTPITFSAGDVLTYSLTKSGTSLILEAELNGETYKVANTIQDSVGNLTVYTGNNNVTILSMGITELQHAATAGRADLADRLNVIYKAGVFTADELHYGQYGIDTANGRVYFRYNNTQVAYTALTVV